MKKCIIIGGGIIGLCSAYYLQKEGHQVTIIDQSDMSGGASYVNAGFISPSHIIPLSAPGVMKKAMIWMLDSSSPLYIKPRFDLGFLKWALAFNKSCNPKHVKKAIPVLKDIILLSQDLYDDIKKNDNFSFQYEKKGLLMLCQTEKMLEKEIETAQIVRNEGLEVKELNLAELEKLEPKVNMNIIGATYYRRDAHTTPNEFMEEMKVYLKSKGVLIFKNEKVEHLIIKNRKINSIITNKQELKADEFVLAAGSWSSKLTKKLGLNLLLQAGKGYRINSLQKAGITVPAILAEEKIAVTPMNGFTRFAGTMEITGINHTINKIRVDAIANAVANYYPDIKLTDNEKSNAKCGLRPLSPDGLPYIGKSYKSKNLTIATGHAMMGWSLATVTGKLVSEIISDKKTSTDLSPFQPDRRF